MTAAVRVFLCTYRRNALLRRAVESLLAQTFTDWVCELHNDDPADAFPEHLIAELGDRRISVVNHPTNLGPTRTFNLMYRLSADERYLSLLEDDNWWEPGFLQRMVAEMDARPEVTVGWSNMRTWEEQVDGTWISTGCTTWDEGDGAARLLYWPHARQVRGALHSHGAMLLRSDSAPQYSIPDSTPSAVIECVRERCFTHPLLLVPTPLANFAITRSDSRGRDRTLWERMQVLLMASFFRYVELDDESLQRIWNDARNTSMSAITPLIATGLCDSHARYLLRQAGIRDWLRFIRSTIRRPRVMLQTLRAKSALPEIWHTLDEATRRTHERAGSPRSFVDNPTSR